jgi:hypothetical protein
MSRGKRIKPLYPGAHVVLGFEPSDSSGAFQVCTVPNKGLADLAIPVFCINM